MFSIKYPGTVCFQRLWNASPVVKVAEVAEKDTMYHENGIFRCADSLFMPLFIGDKLLIFECDLIRYQSDHFTKDEEMDNGNHAADNSDHTRSDAKLLRREKDAQHPVPKYDCLQ